MENQGLILIADDEETFLLSTADLLRREGFVCQTAPDAAEARSLLKQEEFDLIIADIQMPGNAELEFIKELSDMSLNIPVILVTGYPSTDTAISAVHLPVVAYLVKPLDFRELLQKSSLAIHSSQTHRIMNQARDRLQHWQHDLEKVKKLPALSPGGKSVQPLDTFVSLTMDNILHSLTDLYSLTRTVSGNDKTVYPCHMLECPRLEQLEGAVRETVEVLEETKKSFKSKQLFQLRKKLEEVLRESRI